MLSWVLKKIFTQNFFSPKIFFHPKFFWVTQGVTHSFLCLCILSFLQPSCTSFGFLWQLRITNENDFCVKTENKKLIFKNRPLRCSLLSSKATFVTSHDRDKERQQDESRTMQRNFSILVEMSAFVCEEATVCFLRLSSGFIKLLVCHPLTSLWACFGCEGQKCSDVPCIHAMGGESWETKFFVSQNFLTSVDKANSGRKSLSAAKTKFFLSH